MVDYVGDRTIDGIIVTADGVELDPQFAVATFSDMGFEWTYEGDEPRQLALALLCHYLGQASASASQSEIHQRAVSLTEPFMQSVVANFANTWVLSTEDIRHSIETIESREQG